MLPVVTNAVIRLYLSWRTQMFSGDAPQYMY